MLKKWIVYIVLVMNVAGCSVMSTTNKVQAASTTAQLIKHDANLYRVDEKLYRSEQLVAGDRATIEAVGIKSIINLRFFDRDDDETVFRGSNIELINAPLLTWRVKARHIARVLWTIEQQQRKGAVLVHCYHGADRTGIIVAMYRIVQQGWSIADAKREMQQGPFGYHSIWRNLDKLFTEETVQEVRDELQRLRMQAAS